VLVHTIYGAESIPTLETLRRAGIPVYRSLEAVAKAAVAVWRHGGRGDRPGAAASRRSRPEPAQVGALLRAGAEERTVVLEPVAREVLRLYGIPVPPFRVCGSAGETARAAQELGAPVALKLVAPGVVHKSDIGGVLLDVGVAEASAAHGRLLDRARAVGARDAQVLVTPMIREGVETIVGSFRDPQFGPVVMFGLGGVLVEALDDVVFRLAPLDERDARSMLEEVRGHRILRGVRGRPPCELDAAADLLVRVSELAADHPAMVELDLNPVFLGPAGAAIADARLVVGAPTAPAL
jgi:acyl-CoA synthetase (NDP forming)